MGPSQKLDFPQLRLEQTQPTDMLPLFSSEYPVALIKAIFYRFRNGQGAYLHVSDNFIPKGPKELLWLV